MIVQTSQDAAGNTIVRELSPAEREKLNLNIQQLNQQIIDSTRTLNVQLPELKSLQKQLNSPEFRKQMDISNSPEFKQQMEAFRTQTRDLTRESMKLQTKTPEWQNLQKQLREIKIPDITKDPKYQAMLNNIRQQTEAFRNNPAFKNQLAETRELNQLSRTLRADDLAKASASIAEARRTATDDATRAQLDAAQAALDRARKPVILHVDPTNPQP